jgi:hypothetical protein
MKRSIAWLLLVAPLAVTAVQAAPYVPAGDDVVLERLPERTDPSLKQLRAARPALAREPRSIRRT